ncbi:hypothetical protein [Pseudaestuariivita rosea]|uniref:hypothetical protein n=1 Tax=Pseudaestuariivita rosea TaxID=2763263 RepID=UPI001ABB6736|nr:hypothetical protein [Pseudaestuariivita rosea]
MDLRKLHRLFRLDYTDDPFSEEAARLATIHPDDPIAGAARLIADAFDKAMPSIETLKTNMIKIQDAALC